MSAPRDLNFITNKIAAEAPVSALDAAISAGLMMEPRVDFDHGRSFLAMPKGTTWSEVQDPYALPPRIAARVTVDDRASLIAYANRFSAARSILIADYDAGKISARLDWHHANDAEDPLTASHNLHAADLVLRDSEEFARWNAFEGEMHQQAEFAAFLEENAEDIIDPEPETMIEISRDLEAVQDVNFKSSTRLESGDRAFRYETETRTQGELTVPREFRLSIPLYFGESPVTLRCAMRFRITPGGLLLGFDWRRVEYQRQAHFHEMAAMVADGTGLPLFLGRA